MYALQRSNFLKRSYLVNENRRSLISKARPIKHSERIKQELKALGVSTYGLLKFESRYLPHIIQHGEHIMGVVYGVSEGSSAMLIATNRRVIFLNKKPLFMDSEEVTYEVVSGVNYSYAGPNAILTLNTRIKNFTIRTLNKHCAVGFISYIENRRLEQFTHEST